MIFVNCTGETFTPTRSGAISTWIWEVCQEAQRDGQEPLVISRRCNADPHPWKKTIFLDYPWVPTMRGTGIGRLLRIQQQITGWAHQRQKVYAKRVVRAIRKSGEEKMAMFLQNDPELAVYLREQFPNAFIVHLFQNAYGCSSRFRRKFPAAVNVIAAVSKYCASWNEDYFGLESGKIKVLYNGVNTGKYHPAANPPAGRPIINFVGRTDKDKAPDLVLKAARKLVEEGRSFGVQILGARYYWGTERDAYQDEIDRLAAELESAGVEVRRPGVITRDALPDELRRAHIHVVPSRWDDPCPLTTMEGMATGLPTIGSRAGGIPELIDEFGLHFERDSLDGLVGHLRSLVSDDALRLDWGSKARQRAESFTWGRTWRGVREMLPNVKD